MSRRKHRATKMMTGENVATKRGIAVFGDLYVRNPKVCRLVEEWARLFRFLDYANFRIGSESLSVDSLLRDSSRKLGRDQDLLFEVGRYTDFLVGLLRDAIRSGDGQVFRDIAEAVKWVAKPEDKLRLHLLKREKYSDGNITIPRLTKSLPKFGLDAKERKVRKIATELGLRVTAAPRGRRKGS